MGLNDELYEWFPKFWAVINHSVELEVEFPDWEIFNIFYLGLPSCWKDFIQKQIKHSSICWWKQPKKSPDGWSEENKAHLKQIQVEHGLNDGQPAITDTPAKGIEVIDLPYPYTMVNFLTIIDIPAAYTHIFSPKTIFNSGAGAHLFPNRDDFTSFKPFMGKNMCVVNSSTLKIKGIRDAMVSVGDTEITFWNTLYIPELSVNLISTEVLDK
ncbi:hypothetical protein FQN50_006873 [Emmonsiellopsis sp. PD_5]|nr:hypothetical protein FQN50_006873 [Emmonsiellopsis sp. PD_5]